MKNQKKNAALFLLILVVFLFIFTIIPQFNKQEIETLPYSSLLEKVRDRRIEKVTITESEITGEYKNGKFFRTIIPGNDPKLIPTLIGNDVKVEGEIKKEGKFLGNLLTIMLIGFTLLIIWNLFFRQSQGGPAGKVFSFGKSRAKMQAPKTSKVTFKDVAGIKEAKTEVQEIIEFLKEPKKFTKLGARIPKGVLLVGAPGTGKTLLARAIAGEADVPFFNISGSDFVEMFVGVGASRVRDLFEKGKKNAPCIIFIDEIDAVGRYRGAGIGGGHDEREQTLNQLLTEMDGFSNNNGIIMIAATNRPDVLDPALLRPGRFDRQVIVNVPDLAGREAILKVHLKKTPLSKKVKLKTIARGTPGFTGADLENLVNESALLAAKKNQDVVEMDDFEASKDKIMMGPERRSLFINPIEKEIIAYHESGHTLVGKLLKFTDPIHKVTIIPRGMALGVTMSLPLDEKHNYPKEYWEDQLTMLLAGRVAEEIRFKSISTGAKNDIEKATNIAQKMVREWGMSQKIGTVSVSMEKEHVFLGRDIAQHRDYSEKTAELIDEEVKNVISAAYTRATKIIRKNISKLNMIAKELLLKEILSGSDIDKIVDGKKSASTAKNKLKK